MQTTNLTNFTSEDSLLMADCAKNILGHIERNIITNQGVPDLVNRMSGMHRYIRVNFVLGVANYPFYDFDDEDL